MRTATVHKLWGDGEPLGDITEMEGRYSAQGHACNDAVELCGLGSAPCCKKRCGILSGCGDRRMPTHDAKCFRTSTYERKMSYDWYKIGCNWPISKDILLENVSNYAAVFRLVRNGSF